MLELQGLSSCLLGVCVKAGQEDCLIYSVDKIIAVLVNRDDMDIDEAYEFFQYNIRGLNVEGRGVAFMEPWEDV